MGLFFVRRNTYLCLARFSTIFFDGRFDQIMYQKMTKNNQNVNKTFDPFFDQNFDHFFDLDCDLKYLVLRTFNYQFWDRNWEEMSEYQIIKIQKIKRCNIPIDHLRRVRGVR